MTNSTELFETLEEILSTLEGEQIVNHPNSSIGFAEFTIKGKSKKRYIILGEMDMNSNIRYGIDGQPIGIEYSNRPVNVLTPKNTISRDSLIGKLLIQNRVGEFKGKASKVRVELFSSYSQPNRKVGDGFNGNILNKKEEISFESIRKILEKFRELKVDETERQKAKDEAIDKLLEEFALREEKIDKLKKQRKRFIQTELSLRNNPILDAEQEEVKRLKEFDGELIINGGPGTGKTTTLLQRISFLIRDLKIDEQQIKEYGLDIKITKISEEERILFNNQEKSWIFFSPSELLRVYLKEALLGEKLIATDDKVQTWENFREHLMEDMDIINTEKKTAFKAISSKIKHNFYKNNAQNFYSLDESFNTFFWDDIRKNVERVLDFNVMSFSWAETGLKIQSQVKSIPKDNNFSSWIRFFGNLQEFNEAFKEINKEYKKDIERAAVSVMIALKENTDDFKEVNQMIQDDNETTRRTNEDEDEIEINEEIFEEKELSDNDVELKLKERIKIIIRKRAIRLFDKKLNFSTKDRQYLKVLKTYIDNFEKESSKLNSIGEKAFFKRYFEKMTKGVVNNVLYPIKSKYKKFRKQEVIISPLLTEEAINDLPKFLDRNNRLHLDEQDYLIYFIYGFCRKLQELAKATYKNSDYVLISSHKENMKGLVVVDEATDFSIFELAAMRNLTYYRFNSITLIGDVMQRMQGKGINDWQEFKTIFPKTTIANLTIAYRQTYPLVELAKAIYKHVIGKDAPFRAKAKPEDKSFKPILLINNDFDTKVNWLVERILEIKKFYDRKFPSVAIFVKNDKVGEILEAALNDNDKLDGTTLKAEVCLKGKFQGKKNRIRIFDIQYIKGLEFEAVFFMDIDDLGDLPDDLINKYIYVGVSRATFFLGVTANQNLSDGLNYMLPYFDVNGKWGK